MLVRWLVRLAGSLFASDVLVCVLVGVFNKPMNHSLSYSSTDHSLLTTDHSLRFYELVFNHCFTATHYAIFQVSGQFQWSVSINKQYNNTAVQTTKGYSNKNQWSTHGQPLVSGE